MIVYGPVATPERFGCAVIIAFRPQYRQQSAEWGAPLEGVTATTVEFYQETWRIPSTSINTFAAAWGTSATTGVTASNYLSAAGMTNVPELSLVQAPAVPMGVDGNSATYRTLLSYTFDVNLAFGDRFYLRWQDYDDAGEDAILAIDDLKLTFTHSSHQTAAVPEASPLVLLGVLSTGLVTFVALRRRPEDGMQNVALGTSPAGA